MAKEKNTAFGDTFKELRLLRGMKQYKLAELIGITAAQICTYEKGKSVPNLEFLIKICTLLKISPLAFIAKMMDHNKFKGTGLELSFEEYESILFTKKKELIKQKLEKQLALLESS